MSAKSAKLSRGEALNPDKLAASLAILDNARVVRFTPANSSDASRPEVEAAYDSSYLYVQTAAGTWKRAALSSF